MRREDDLMASRLKKDIEVISLLFLNTSDT